MNKIQALYIWMVVLVVAGFSVIVLLAQAIDAPTLPYNFAGVLVGYTVAYQVLSRKLPPESMRQRGKRVYRDKGVMWQRISMVTVAYILLVVLNAQFVQNEYVQDTLRGVFFGLFMAGLFALLALHTVMPKAQK